MPLIKAYQLSPLMAEINPLQRVVDKANNQLLRRMQMANTKRKTLTALFEAELKERRITPKQLALELVEAVPEPPRKIDRPGIRRRQPDSENDFIAVHSEATNTEHFIRKSDIARLCRSRSYEPGSRLFMRDGTNMVVLEDTLAITACLLE